MRKNLENNSTDWTHDLELKEILGIDDFQISELIISFDLIAYDIDGDIRHFYENDRNLSELIFEIASLKFRKKEVDEFIKNYPNIGNSAKGRPEPYLWRLQNRLKNIQYLEQIRDQQLLPPSSHLKKSEKRINDQIRDSEKEVLQNSLKEDCVNSIKRAKPEIEMIWKAIKKVGLSGRVEGAEDKWQEAALKELKNKENRFNIITKDYLLDRNLYSLSATQEKRDFVGGVLQKIINPQCGKIGKDKLYDIFKKLE